MGMSDYYQGLRDRVGCALLLIPAVAAVVRDDKGHVLLQQKHDGSWSLPAGAIEPGETPGQAVVREVFEETDLRVTPKRIAGVVGGESCRTKYPNGHEVEYVIIVFECAVASGELLASGDETKRLTFVDVKEVHSLLSFPYPQSIFDEASSPAFSERV
jgi:8-oxo-dGTP pyrophosphatase MutT (NUDIX family)